MLTEVFLIRIKQLFILNSFCSFYLILVRNFVSTEEYSLVRALHFYSRFFQSKMESFEKAKNPLEFSFKEDCF